MDNIVHLADMARENGRAAKILTAMDFPDVTATGTIKPTAANARKAITKLGITCRYDVFHDKLAVSRSDSTPAN